MRFSGGIILARYSKKSRNKPHKKENPAATHRKMSAVRAKNSDIEIALRSELFKSGYRYRKNYRGLPGTPDVVFPKEKLVIFCDSEFWHGFDWPHQKRNIRTNRTFWLRKIEQNIQRDKRVTGKLARQGWKVLRFWGHEIKKNLGMCVRAIENNLHGNKV